MHRGRLEFQARLDLIAGSRLEGAPVVSPPEVGWNLTLRMRGKGPGRPGGDKLEPDVIGKLVIGRVVPKLLIWEIVFAAPQRQHPLVSLITFSP